MVDKAELRETLKEVMHSMANENPDYDILRMHNKFGKRITRKILQIAMLTGTVGLYLSPVAIKLRLSILWLKLQLYFLRGQE